MTSRPVTRSHEELAQLLRRVGYSDDFIRKVLSDVPDPIDVQRDQHALARHGLNAEQLMDWLGGSP